MRTQPHVVDNAQDLAGLALTAARSTQSLRQAAVRTVPAYNTCTQLSLTSLIMRRISLDSLLTMVPRFASHSTGTLYLPTGWLVVANCEHIYSLPIFAYSTACSTWVALTHIAAD